jgi:hypothetical protein
MAKWPLIGRQDAVQGHGPHGLCEDLPLFYMNDYSCLGLRVASCGDARRVLAEERFRVVEDDVGRHVVLANAAEVQAAVALLNRRGVACDIADLADQIYQG